jgi:hypothetical protein
MGEQEVTESGTLESVGPHGALLVLRSATRAYHQTYCAICIVGSLGGSQNTNAIMFHLQPASRHILYIAHEEETVTSTLVRDAFKSVHIHACQVEP